jgi:flagellar basal body-associated protein FliL
MCDHLYKRIFFIDKPKKKKDNVLFLLIVRVPQINWISKVTILLWMLRDKTKNRDNNPPWSKGRKKTFTIPKTLTSMNRQNIDKIKI